MSSRAKNAINLFVIFLLGAFAIYKAAASAHGWFALYFVFLVAPAFLVVYLVPAVAILIRNVRNKFVYYQYAAILVSIISAIFIIGDNGDVEGQYWLGKEYVEEQLPRYATGIGVISFILFHIGILALWVLLITTASSKKEPIQPLG